MTTAVWIVLGLAAAVTYALSCWWFPYGKCQKCSGTGKKYASDGKHFRDCRRCKGAARRLRVGRRVWNWWYARRKAAT